MRYLKKIELHTTGDIFHHPDLDSRCKALRIKNYTINGDGSIDVDGDVNLSIFSFSKIPIKFKNVTGNFYCQDNQLISLDGCPISVGGDFECSNNKLSTLEGGPTIVGGNYHTSVNKLISLEGCADSVYMFSCKENRLTSLKGCPQKVKGNFDCQYNKIMSFEYLPMSLGNRLYYKSNPVEIFMNLLYSYDDIDMFNDYDIIQDDVVILERLNDFLSVTYKNKPDITESFVRQAKLIGYTFI